MSPKAPAMFKVLTPRLLRVYLFASMGAINFGYDNNWWSGVITVDTFIQDYGKSHGSGEPRTLPSSWLSAATGTPLVGWILGCAIASFLNSRHGRKKTLVILCVIALVGMIIQCVVANFWALMVGRLVNSFSMGIEANTVPMYMAELAPPAIRGGLVNFYQSWMMVGAIMAGVVVFGAYNNAVGRWVYLTPIVVQIIPPTLLLVAVWFIPESPRWLLSKNKREKAFSALRYMREGASTEEETAQELELVAAATEHEVEMHRATGYLDCFKGSNFYRTLVAVGVQCLQQAQGNSFTQAYLVIFLQQLGVTDPLLIKIAHSCCSFGGTVLAFYLTDKLGRRTMLIGGAALMGSTLWITSGLAAWTPGEVTGAKAQTAIAMILLNAAISTGAWGSCMWTVTVEVSTQQLRERTIALATIFGFITSLLITYINPYVQNEPGNLGAKVGLVYGSMSVIGIAFVYLFVPEMKGRSLEELDEMYHSGVPAWRSKKFVGEGIGAQITRVQNADGPAADIKGGGRVSVDEVPRSTDL